VLLSNSLKTTRELQFGYAFSRLTRRGKKEKHFNQVSENDIADVGYYSIHCKIIFRVSNALIECCTYDKNQLHPDVTKETRVGTNTSRTELV
jgi:hypothetical protein